jgi:hypothetical protein
MEVSPTLEQDKKYLRMGEGTTISSTGASEGIMTLLGFTNLGRRGNLLC